MCASGHQAYGNTGHMAVMLCKWESDSGSDVIMAIYPVTIIIVVVVVIFIKSFQNATYTQISNSLYTT